MSSAASIVGWGMRCGIGLDAVQTGMLHRAGAAAMIPAPLGPDGEDVAIGALAALPATCTGEERHEALARPVVREALAHLDLGRTVLLLSLDPAWARRDPDGAATLGAALLHEVRAHAPDVHLEVVARGEAGPCHVLDDWASRLVARQLDHIVLVGVHSDHDPAAIAELIAQDRLYADDNLDAVIPGEAAAAVVLAAAGGAAVLGVGHGMEEARFDDDRPTAPARALTAAMRQATKCLADRHAQAGWLISDVGFERWRLREWQTVYVRSHARLGPPHRVDNPAQRLGALGAAAIPFAMALAAEGWRAGWAPAPYALVLAGSETGERGAMVLAAPGAAS